MKIFKSVFNEIVSAENLLASWRLFKRGKKRKTEIANFEYRLEENLFRLRRGLLDKTYEHGDYFGFYVHDPKTRHIHKSDIRDRVLHHAVFRVLNPIFEPTFIAESFSCRVDKGTHRAVEKLYRMLRKVSRNNTQTCWALKCDIQKFFASVDHQMLLKIIGKKIKDPKALWLVSEIIGSFPQGVPIGNLTSQLFANIYLNELDQYIKQTLKIPFYLRYTDDFIILNRSKEELTATLGSIRTFLQEKLLLQLHPRKVIFRKLHQGVDFLGYVQFPHHRLLRSRTKKRIINKLNLGVSWDALNSYLGVLSHADTYELTEELKNIFWLNKK